MTKAGKTETDVLLVGAGIMSATLGALLKELQPNLSVQIFERLDIAAAESSDAWNNAGTGHAAFCELNYTPQGKDGSIDISKAIKIAESFEVSKQFWAYLIQQHHLDVPASFITRIPHLSFVWGEENVKFLRSRFEKMQKNPLFADMQYSEDHNVLREWMPLMMENRKPSEMLAATRMEIGTDVNFGSLTQSMFSSLQKKSDVQLHFNHEVRKLKQNEDGSWIVKVKNRATGDKRKIKAKFVFVGAGGGSLRLLEKSGIPEGRGYGGFPVSGQWLKCVNPEVIKRHHAKVYGKASVGAPPMSVPHLDTRIINNEQELLFGPYAGFSTKFLKEGSYLDLFKSIKYDNLVPMIAAGLDNIPLTRYLINQVRQSPEDRLEALRDFIPDAKLEDWKLEIAGQRVQVIKKDKEHVGVLEFGTEVIAAKDGSIAALLGASPGASTAVSIMLTLLEKCFSKDLASPEWQSKLKKMIPSFGQSLSKNEDLLDQVRTTTNEVLGLQTPTLTHH
ncbi:malate:quinone oxidoreductase [Pseudochryseolinea flava]|uniref:Probable malate:quinone oxidoreductase n=1 Tax=Pseudochryseolinea flava TaxID=2059302 RepID=A0A364XVZ8_9BACT|nr:malate:quinone oxidoreductase [Pseudochryseolinea flava]RAV98495.1 malate:quinone oxidoreductase [Pseudochryseolinea flava]